jgi:hypothetical protein
VGGDHPHGVSGRHAWRVCSRGTPATRVSSSSSSRRRRGQARGTCW